MMRICLGCLVLIFAGVGYGQISIHPEVIPPRVKQLKDRTKRIDKASYVVSHLYSNPGEHDFLPYVPYLVDYHASLEQATLDRGGQGYDEAYWYSLIYGAANFSLRCRSSAPGNCEGPMDVKHYPPIRDPRANIRYHCDEMLGFYLKGVRGLDLCYHVFYPPAPRDWASGKFQRTDEKMRACLARGQRLRLLGLRGKNTQASLPKYSIVKDW